MTVTLFLAIPWIVRPFCSIVMVPAAVEVPPTAGKPPEALMVAVLATAV